MRRLIIFIKNLFSIPYRILFTKISATAGLQDAIVDKKAAICGGAKFYRSKIGKYSYIGNKTFVTNATIGNFTSIAGNCYIGGTSHPVAWVSTSSVFHRWKNIFHKNFASLDFEPFKETTIGNDVWVGEGVKIKAGVTIGDGAIIGMGSIVTHDVGAYEIWAGNPARKIRDRFSDEEMVKKLETLEWWNWDDEKIQKYAHLFGNPEALLESLMKTEE